MIAIGALAPLSPPGLAPAGRDLRDGILLAAAHINEAGGVHGRLLNVLVRDTGAGPRGAASTVEQLAASGVAALVGEFHSAVAVPASAAATRLEIPYVCSSATSDKVTRDNPVWVFRLAAAQSRGWRLYADHLADSGGGHALLVVDPDAYWLDGACVLVRRLEERGVAVSQTFRTRSDGDELHEVPILDQGRPIDVALLLVAFPDPFRGILQGLRRRWPGVAVGDPAGRMAFSDCVETVGREADGISYLAYLPSQLTDVGTKVSTRFRAAYGRDPSFVALEGYDSTLTLAAALNTTEARGDRLRDAITRVQVEGTRGRIVFDGGPGGGHQWQCPIRVDAVPARPPGSE